jgi:hypothetical protein
MLHEGGTGRMGSIKTIGASGQIALGKEYAGRNVLVEEIEPGVWVVKLGDFIPDNERWLHTARVSEELDEAVAWAEVNPPAPSDLNRLSKRAKR